MRCTARASPVGRVRRRANAFSLCGLSHCDDSPPLRHATAFCFHCMSNSSTRYERRTRHSASSARRILKHALRAARHGISFLHCMSNSSTRGAHNMATSCTRKEWATAVAADIGRLGRDAPILEEHISFSPQCRQSIMMEPARQR